MFITDNHGAEQAVTTNLLHASGYTLPNALKFTDFYVNYADAAGVTPRRRITIIPAHMKGDSFINPSAILEGGKLYPVDPEGRDWQDETDRAGWTDAASIEWHYIAVPSAYTAVAGTDVTNPVTISDHGVPALVDALGAWMAVRLVNVLAPVAVQTLTGLAGGSRAEWLALVDQFNESEARYVHQGSY